MKLGLSTHQTEEAHDAVVWRHLVAPVLSSTER